MEHAPFFRPRHHVPTGSFFTCASGPAYLALRCSRLQYHIYHYHPLDVVGWDGHLSCSSSVHDFSPVRAASTCRRIHQTFEANNFVICTFAPRMLDYHPQAIKVPYNHSNLDSDEVLYYVDGNFSAPQGDRDRQPLTLHPAGHPARPAPGGRSRPPSPPRTRRSWR